MKKNILGFVGSVLAAGMLMACAGGPNERSTGETVDDARILATAKGALVKDPEIKGSSVDVDVNRGEVTLTGVARSEREKKKIVETVWGVNGVKSVRSNIEIKEPKP
jgi:hyperosmotically inducible protein